MRKGLILLGVALLMILGILVVGTLRNSCSYAPDGSLNLGLATDTLLHSADELSCDPWRVVEADPEVVSVEITGTDGGSFQPMRPVTISRDGRIAIYEPVGPDFQNADLITEGRADDLASRWIDQLSVFSGHNRFAEPDPEATSSAEEHGENFSIRQYMEEPVIKCWGEVSDAGGMTLIVTFADGSDRWIYLDRSCASPAMSRASQALYAARDAVYRELDYPGDHHSQDVDLE